MNKYCLIICVINEGHRFQQQIIQLSKYKSLIDVIVVDGRSTDGSTDTHFLSQHSVRYQITNYGSTDLSSQLHLGLLYAKSKKYSGIILMDGNGKDDVAAIPRFITALNNGYQFVQGSRFLPGGQYLNTPADRLWGIRHIQVPLFKFFTHFNYTDPANGFKAFSRSILLDDNIGLLRPIFKNYSLQYYITASAPKHLYQTTEIPVKRNYPGTGQPPTKITSLSKKIAVLTDVLHALTGHYDPSNFRLTDNMLRYIRNHVILKYFNFNHSNIVLDIGCGTDCFLLREILSRIKYYIGVDSQVYPRHQTNWQTIKSDISNHQLSFSPLPNIIIGSAIIEHLPDPKSVLASLYQKSQPNCHLILTTPTPPFSHIILKIFSWLGFINPVLFADHHQYYSRHQITSLLTDTGWKITRYKYFLFGLNSLIIAQKSPCFSR